jgi:hypothetical protein
MVKKTILILFLCFLCGCSGKHFSKFTPKDYAYQLAGTIATGVDWKQTRGFESRGRIEQNPILGERPSQAKINTLIPFGIACQWLTAWALPVEAEIFGFRYNPRRVFQIGIIASEGWAVNHNYHAGASINF